MFFISQKGKLKELASILDNHPDLRPELYNNDPWVEFIDLDIEEQSDRLMDLDTDFLMHRSLSSNCTPLSIGFRDDDSGRASCCDPDVPSDPEASPFHPLIPNQMLSNGTSCLTAYEEPSSPIQSHTDGEPPFIVLGREALSTKVSEVRSSGKVLPSAEEQTEVKETNSKDEEKDIIAEKKKELQLLVVNPDHGGYTSELNPGKMSLTLATRDMSETSGDMSSFPSISPYQEPNKTPISPFSPAPDYTVVEAIDGRNSLLLTPNSTPAPQLIIPKTMPTPDVYLTPDLLGSIDQW